MRQRQLNDRIDVDPNALITELGRIHDKTRSSSESSSTLGHQRKTASEQLGCNKGALKMIEDIDAYSDEKLGDFLRSFLPMVQAMSSQWLKWVRDMVDQSRLATGVTVWLSSGTIGQQCTVDCLATTAAGRKFSRKMCFLIVDK